MTSNQKEAIKSSTFNNPLHTQILWPPVSIRDFVVLTSEKTPSSRGFCRVLEKPRSSPDLFCPSLMVNDNSSVRFTVLTERCLTVFPNFKHRNNISVKRNSVTGQYLPQVISHGEKQFSLKIFKVTRDNGAETNCGITRILGILLMNSCDT